MTSSKNPGQTTGVDRDERDGAAAAHEVLDAHLVAGEAQEPRVRVDHLVGAADPAPVGAL